MSLKDSVFHLLHLYINLKSLGVEELPTFNPENYRADPIRSKLTPEYIDEGTLLIHPVYYEDEISLLKEIGISSGIATRPPLSESGFYCYSLPDDHISLQFVELESSLILVRGSRPLKDRENFSTEFCLDVKQYGTYWLVLRD